MKSIRRTLVLWLVGGLALGSLAVLAGTYALTRGQIGRNDNTVAVGTALKKYGITGATIAGGHGTTAKQSDIEPALAQK